MTVQIINADVMDGLRQLPDDSVHCVVTSPPYWGLRDYGVDGQIGLEPTMGEHIDRMVEVFREVRRVLRPDGTLWLNYGDCYATSPNGRSASDTKAANNDDRTFRDKPFSTIGGVLKPKDLCMIPNRIAIALQEPYHLGPIKNEVDRAWLAGLIDADGCIGIRREDNGKWNPSYIPYLTVGCSDRKLVERCAQITGLGRVNLKSHAGDTDARGIRQRRDGYVWRLDGQIASRVIRDIYPHLVQKQMQAVVCNAMNISQEGGRPTRSRPVASDVIAYRQTLYEGIKALNQRREILFPDLPDVQPNIEQGWWVRSEIIWGKSNPMPDSSGSQRPSTAHEKIFLLAKSTDGDIWRARDTGDMSDNPDLGETCPLIGDPNRIGPRWQRIGSYYDAETVRVGRSSDEDANGFRGGSYVGGVPSKRAVVGNKLVKSDKQRGHSRRHAGFNDRWDAMDKDEQQANGRYLRNYEEAPLSVWRIATKAFPGAHFATFPPELAERCILAGCPRGGTVLDIFGGAGTVGLVADGLQRNAILIEINKEYAELARARIAEPRGFMNIVDPVKTDESPEFVQAEF